MPGRNPLIGSLLVSVVLVGPAVSGEITQRSLRSNLLGREYRYSLYLPDGYAESPSRYSVLYLLHGATGDEHEWPRRGAVLSTMDRLLGEGEIPPLVIVMPGHWNSWWIDGNHEPAETVLCEELIPHVDTTLRTITRREGRLVAGLSAGGFGAVNLAFDHPDLFAAAAALSPALYVPLPPETSGARRAPQFLINGRFDPQTWERLSYVPRLRRYEAAGLVVPFFFVSGDGDRLGIALQTATLFERLRSHQPGAVELRVVDGGHDWAVWRAALPDALRYLCRFSSPPEPAR